MSIVLSDKIYTVEDYMKMDDGNRYELIGGKLIMVPKPRPIHQKVALRIATAFEVFLKLNPIGEVFYEVDVHLGDKVVGPDILFIAKDRTGIIGELNIQGAPDLVVEILSPSTVVHDKKIKSQLYYSNGVKEYWVVDPDEKLVEVFVAGEKNWTWMGVFDQEDVLTTTLLPGLEISLSEVFKRVKNNVK